MVGGQNRRPDVLADLASVVEERTGTERFDRRPGAVNLDLVLFGAAHNCDHVVIVAILDAHHAVTTTAATPIATSHRDEALESITYPHGVTRSVVLHSRFSIPTSRKPDAPPVPGFAQNLSTAPRVRTSSREEIHPHHTSRAHLGERC